MSGGMREVGGLTRAEEQPVEGAREREGEKGPHLSTASPIRVSLDCVLPCHRTREGQPSSLRSRAEDTSMHHTETDTRVLVRESVRQVSAP